MIQERFHIRCTACHRYEIADAETPQDAIKTASNKGWKQCRVKNGPIWHICPNCRPNFEKQEEITLEKPEKTKTPLEALKSLLENPYPFDLINIRNKIREEYGSEEEAEEMAKEEEEIYCTEEFLQTQLKSHRKAVKDAKVITNMFPWNHKFRPPITRWPYRWLETRRDAEAQASVKPPNACSQQESKN